MDLTAALRAFVRTVQRGSMSAAARDLGLSQPAVSKALRNLEAKVGARLLERSPRALRLTAHGETLYQSAHRTITALDDTLEEVRSAAKGIGGRLSIHAPVCLGEAHLNGIVADYQSRFPAVRVEMTLANGAVDLVGQGIDLAVTMGRPQGNTSVVRRIGTVERVLVASQAYLDRHGTVDDPRVLGDRDTVMTPTVLSRRNAIRLWRQDIPVDVTLRPALTTNSATVLLEALRAGRGIGAAQTLLVADELREGRLVRLLPDWDVEGTELFLQYPAPRRPGPALRALIEHVVPALQRVHGISTDMAR